MGVGSNPTSDKNIFGCKIFISIVPIFLQLVNIDSRVAQWKRAGPITQRSVDRNYALLKILFLVLCFVL